VSNAGRIPAIKGGIPVRRTLLPYGHHSISRQDIQAVVDVLQSDWITTGPKVAEFEEALARYVNAKHAVSFSSGTAALHGATYAAGLKPGDQAITTPMTFCATANCVIYRGATPIFADVRHDTLNLDPQEVEKNINESTRALIPVDYAGHPVELDFFRDLAEDNDLVMIEDASHALGAAYKERRVGGLSDMTIFSFHPVKHITTGEGGMVATDDEELAQRLRIFRNHGIEGDARQRQLNGQWYYEMVDLGYNYRLTDIGCALGLSQLERINANINRRREIALAYKAAFEDLKSITLPIEMNYGFSSWHLYPIRLNLKELKVGRAEVFAALRAENIGVNVHYIPVHKHPYYREQFGYEGGEFPIAEEAYERLISLPIFHGMTDMDIADVIEAVLKVIRYFSK